MKKYIGIGSALVFFVVAGVFAIVLSRHIDGSKFNYPQLQVTERPGKLNGSVQIMGMDADQPLKDFAQQVNEHIADLNHERAEESKSLIWLDVIGIISALLAGFLELFRALSEE